MEFIKKRAFYIIIFLFSLTFVADALFVFPAGAQRGEFIINGEAPIKVEGNFSAGSPFLDKSARIGEEAAFTEKGVCSPASCQTKPVCQSFPAEVWVFLLLAFAGLLIFNLAFGFGAEKRLRWGWELTYFALTLLVWFKFDQCRTHIWFPLYVIKSAMIIYLAYLYFFDRKDKMA